MEMRPLVAEHPPVAAVGSESGNAHFFGGISGVGGARRGLTCTFSDDADHGHKPLDASWHSPTGWDEEAVISLPG